MRKFFYVTAIYGTKVVALLGPYDNHAAALENVDRGRSMALGYDKSGKASFASYGTSGSDEEFKTVFGK
ncbi:hypothetical protein Milano_096 [Agrobacterium phage Milano]|nr:hypothetical protein Milano_096 [Agrobacterium phage Milano]